jgi:hypothetical protein
VVCVRQAWLALGSNTIQLDNPSGGWSCTSLDLGSPTVRSVMQNRPWSDGAIDRTQFMGPRTVSAAITVMASGGVRIDDIADNFAPYMAPNARPVLHYVLDRGSNPERTLAVRGEAFDWPIAGAAQRDLSLQFIAADPVARDVNTQSVTCFVTPQTQPHLSTPGDVLARPQFSIIGPWTTPYFRVYTHRNTGVAQPFSMASGYSLAAGHTILVDAAAHTVTLDANPNQSLLNQVNWSLSTWPVIPADGDYCIFQSLGPGTGATAATGVTATWNDGYFA